MFQYNICSKKITTVFIQILDVKKSETQKIRYVLFCKIYVFLLT